MPRWLLACLFLLPLTVQADEIAPLRIADLLFPDSRAWPTFEEHPVVPPDSVTAETLKQLAAALKTENAPECPAFALDPEAPLRRAQWRGGAALIYSGLAHCREGTVTIVWLPGKEPGSFTSEDFPFRILRLRPGPAPAISSIEPGCCGDPMDRYNLSAGLGLAPPEGVRSTSMLEIPEGAVEDRQPRQFTTEIALRVAPVAVDDYDPDLSQLMDQAALGNVARKYLPGTAGERILRYTDKAGQRWSLVKIPREHNVKAVYNFLPVNLGWIAE